VAVLVLLLCGIPDRLPVECRRVDVIELNHVLVVEDRGAHPVVRETVVQWIFWVWSPQRGRYCVVDWRMANGAASLAGNVLVFTARGRLYRVEAAAVRETWGPTIPNSRPASRSRWTGSGRAWGGEFSRPRVGLAGRRGYTAFGGKPT
jgi:hypothetical protein